MRYFSLLFSLVGFLECLRSRVAGFVGWCWPFSRSATQRRSKDCVILALVKFKLADGLRRRNELSSRRHSLVRAGAAKGQ